MTRTEAVWHWQKRVANDDVDSLDHWESLISEGFIPDGTVLRKAGHKTATVEVFTTDPARAEDLRLAFGGRVEQVDAAMLMRAAPSGGAPLRIRDRLIVTESTGADEIAALERRHPGRAVLSFPPELAFGTGRHDTTGTCLRLLADIARERASSAWEMLDLGSGTGILAIAAVALGAERAVGIDNDDFAVEVAQRNAGRHHRMTDGSCFATHCEFSGADLLRWKPPGRGRFEVVAANLFADLLCDQLPRIADWLAADGDLVVSGILHTQLDAVLKAATKAGLVFRTPQRRGKWIAMRGHLAKNGEA